MLLCVVLGLKSQENARVFDPSICLVSMVCATQIALSFPQQGTHSLVIVWLGNGQNALGRCNPTFIVTNDFHSKCSALTDARTD